MMSSAPYQKIFRPFRSDQSPARRRSCSNGVRSAGDHRETGGRDARRTANNESRSGSSRSCDPSSSQPHARGAPRNSATPYRFRTSSPTRTTAGHSRHSGMSRHVFRDRAGSRLAAQSHARATPGIAPASTSGATHLDFVTSFSPIRESTNRSPERKCGARRRLGKDGGWQAGCLTQAPSTPKTKRPTAGAAGRLLCERRLTLPSEPQAVVSPSSLPVASPKLVTGTPIKSRTEACRFAIGVSSAYLM